MNPIRTRTGLPLLALVCLAVAGPTPAQGLHVPPDRHPDRRIVHQPVRLTLLQVRAEVDEGVASTELRQVFRNDGGREAEGEWILPLPPGAVADRFTMTINGKDTPGEVLDANRARQIYTDIVRRMQDPGLLEYFGSGCLRARLYPIPAQGETTVVVRYRQVLPETAGMREWAFPLRAATCGGRPAEKVSLDLSIRSSKPIKNVWSPLAGVQVVHKSDGEARVGLECASGQMPERDVVVYYGLSEQAFGLHTLTHRRQGQPGYFIMLLAPKVDWSGAEVAPRSIRFVVDTSGSMQGRKMEQARAALRFFVNSLKPKDTFNVVPFATEAQPLFPAPVAASDENKKAALDRIAQLEARGGTNIEDGLGAALKEGPDGDGATRVPIVVFLTDGQPTVATTRPEDLLGLVRTRNQSKARIFVFGVGSDVNTQLLDTIAGESRGDRDYVREHEDIEVKTGALFAKLSHPVLTDLALGLEGLNASDLAPKTLPDLFQGSRLVIVGRYSGAGHKAVRLRGRSEGKDKEFVYEAAFPEVEARFEFVASLWAQARVGQLLDAIRLSGPNPELVQEVTRLGKEFQIVTPYTSHLILEDNARVAVRFGRADAPPLVPIEQERLRRELERQGIAAGDNGWGSLFLMGSPPADARKEGEGKLARLGTQATGEEAVDDSVRLRDLAGRAAGAPAAPAPTGHAGGGGRVLTIGGLPVATRSEATAQVLARRIGTRNFQRIGAVWVDDRFQESMRERVRKVQAFSDEYFVLLGEHPELAAVFAFSTRVVVVLGDGQAIEIVEA
ncbi:MAG: VWA domain-containing protein [Planctomycetes bacterium]|nr:VWA domain-containing protein [Planctomycetota bacterium]